MTHPIPTDPSAPAAKASSQSSDPGLFKVATGASISGGLTYLFWLLLASILTNLPPIKTDGPAIARSVSVGVRYLLVGSIGLMTFMFGVVAVGLAAYSGQLVWLGLTGRNPNEKAGFEAVATEKGNEAVLETGDGEVGTSSEGEVA